VEDCVREMVRMAVDEFAHLGPDTLISARQRNLETIHQHDVVAERHGLLDDLRREVSGEEHTAPHVSPRDWLERA
jgi:GTP cyclohydrolase I/GTP cyclohydrolase-4